MIYLIYLIYAIVVYYIPLYIIVIPFKKTIVIYVNDVSLWTTIQLSMMSLMYSIAVYGIPLYIIPFKVITSHIHNIP